MTLAVTLGALAVPTTAQAGPLGDWWNGVVAFFTGASVSDEGVAPAGAGDESTVADGSTLTAWESHLSPDGDSTQNIGRIWTDKTVQDGSITLQPVGETIDKGNSDFLVGLSALSSMSSITNEVPKPLDIVLVLDTSSSMLSEMSGSPQYSRVNPSDVTTENGYYWVQDDSGSYQRVQQYPNQNYWYYQDASGYHYVEPTNQHPDNDYINVATFYSISNSRLAALKEAVDGFIDSTNTANQEMPDGEKHNIALITYGQDATVRSGFTEDASALKGVVDGLPANNTTRSDLGMEAAQKLIHDNGRADARKVVIFFTDGKPAKGGDGSFSPEVANDAITIGSDLNSEGTLVYTVGVFEGADVNETVVDPNNETTWFNAYMNGMSSKYPFATDYEHLGDRVGTREYYKVASDEAGLAQVFQEIASELKTEMSDSPLSSGGAGGEEGYLTFTDELGKYMEVDSVKSIVFANQQFTQSSSSTDDSTHVTTYVFNQEVTDSTGIFPNGNLNQIIIKVQKYPGDLAKGDTVTVEIPANLIPLRNYKASVDKEGNVAWGGVTAAYPVRVFYGVSLKADAAAAIKSGTTGDAAADAKLEEYIEANTSEVDGHKSVNFLSNLFEGTPGEGSGTTTAKFTPADSNGYYYVQEDTPLYVYAGEEPADVKDVDPSKLVILNDTNYTQYNPTNVYYKQTVYKEGSTQAVDEIVAIPIDKFAEGVQAGMVEGDEADGYYLVKGSPRLTRITEFEDAKGELPGSNNDTNTAALAVNPNWDTRAHGSGITVQLGNNGKLSVELPGELHVSKEVTVADGLDKEQFENTEFSFEVSVPSMAGKTVQAKVVATNGGAVIRGPFEFVLDNSGKRIQNLKDGETLVISGLDDGAAYTVTETLPQDNGFTQSSEGATGAISSSAASEAKFTNRYEVAQTSFNGVSAQKKFTDADTGADMTWDGATFDFVIEAIEGNANGGGSRDGAGNAITNVADIPMPDGSNNGVKHQAVNSSDAFNFGSINYTKPGTYVYHVWEQTPETDADNWRAGVAYSAAVYHVKVVVKDDGQGALYVDEDASTMYMELNDDGDATNATDKADIAVIENTYKKDTAQSQFQATKTLFDTTTNTSRTPDDGRFNFVVEAVGGTAKDGSKIPVADVPLMKTGLVLPNSGSSVVWSHIEFTNAMEGNTYTYKLYESQPTVDGKYESAGVDSTAKQNDNGEWVWRGITYDKTVYTAEVHVVVDVVNEGQPDEDQHVHADITYKDAEGNVVYKEDGTTLADRVPFVNTYAVTSIDGSALQVQKTLDGRAMNDGEEFTFTQTLIAGDSTGVSGLNREATVTGDGSKTVDTSNFGVPTFTKPGTYTFQIEEQGTNGNGLMYDIHKATVTYVVNDSSEDGQIAHTGNLRVVSVTYDNAAALTPTDRGETGFAAFTNTYRTNLTFPGITVSKTLNGRAMVAGEFGFTITPQNQNAIDRGVAESDAKFSNKNKNASGVTENMTGKLTSLKFTQADNGKDFTYIIDENEGDKPGVTYDTRRYHLTIHVSDDGNGNLTATSTIKLADANGNPTGDAVPAAFVNEYVPADSNAVTPQLNKILTGRDWTDDDTFTFNIEKVSATIAGMTPEDALAAMPLPMKDGNETTSVTLNANGEVTNTKSGASVPIDFGSLTFAKAGTYRYQVTEVIPSDARNEAVKDDNGLIPYEQASDAQKKQSGWKKGGMTYTVRPTVITVTVTDNTAEGKLEVSIAQDNRGNFRNSYAASQSFDGAVSFQLTKQLNGHDMAANQFQFNVTALDGVNVNAADTAMKFHLSEDGKETSIPVPGAAGNDGQKVVMPAGSKQVVFTQADSGKTFMLQFDEVQKSATEAPGYTYDNAKYVMEITPTDLGNGTMSITTKVTKTWTDAEGVEREEVTEHTWEPGEDKDAVSIDFVNSYAATGTLIGSTDLKGKKVLKKDGKEMELAGRTWNFTIAGGDDATKRAIEDGTVALPTPATVQNGEDGSFSFGDITFKSTGKAEVTYKFEIVESGTLDGVTNDSAKTVTVKVTDDGKGNLIATVREGANPTFTNTYSTEGNSNVVTPQVTKKIVGSEANGKTFSFDLTPDMTDKFTNDNVGHIKGLTDGKLTVTTTDALTTTSDQTLTFGNLMFDAEGTYKFNITETTASAAGWMNDTTAKSLTVKVSDNGKGGLTAEITNGDNPTVTNKYVGGATDKTVDTSALFSKEISGRDWSDDDSFGFTLTAKTDGAPMPEGSAAGTTTATATVTAPQDKSGVQTFGFGTFKFSYDDIKDQPQQQDGSRSKDFVYEVTENDLTDAQKAAGLTKDTRTATLTIKVMDNGKGELSVTHAVMTVENGNFVNTYSSELDYTAVAGIQLQKTLNGRDMTEGQFAFTLSNFSEGAAEKLGLDSVTDAYQVTSAEAGKASTINLFAGKSVKFTNADAGKTYSFDVTETKKGTPEAGANGNGYTNDATKWHVEIAVTYDKTTGVLTVTTTATADGKDTIRKIVTSDGAISEGAATLPFVKEYQASTTADNGTSAVIEATKSLTGRPLEDGEFAFTLTGPGLGAAGKTVYNQGDKVAFGTFDYTAAKLEDLASKNQAERTTVDGKRAWKLTYTATEATDGFADKGLTASRQSFPVTVTVVDNGDGSLTANVAYPAEGDKVFQNTYNASEATLSLAGKKVLNYAAGLTPDSIEGKFTFTLTDEADNVIATAKNDANGNVEFTNALTYTLDELNNLEPSTSEPAVVDAAEGVDAQAMKREWLFTYYVTESGNLSSAGITNDAENPKKIQVKVTDDGLGHVTANVVKTSTALDFTFTNAYSVQPVTSSITDRLSVTKTLNGRDMAAGEFEFGMFEGAGTEPVATGTNGAAANGTAAKVTFTPITFKAPGEHDYTIRELTGSGSGITPGGEVFSAHASVKDLGNGTLEVTWSFSPKADEGATTEIGFTNTYTAQPTSFQVNAAKYLEGRDLAEGEFTFELREGDKVLQTVTNGADGDVRRIKFDAIPYDSVGEHDYSIVEVPGNAEGVTYDDTVFTYHVSVVDNGKGQLEVNWTEGETGAPVFENSYEAPAEPEPEPVEPEPSPEVPESENPEEPPAPEVPDTGDRTNVAMPVAIALAGVAVVGVAWVTSRRHRG